MPDCILPNKLTAGRVVFFPAGHLPSLLVWLILFLLTRGISAAEEEWTERPVSLKECVLLALQHAYDLQIQALDLEIAAAQVGVSRAAYDPVLTATIDHSDVTSPGGIDTRTGDFQRSMTESNTFAGSVTGLLPSGGQYTIGASVSDTEGTIGPLPFATASGRGPFIQLRQPLLENLALDDTRLNIRISEKNLRISSLDLQLGMLQTVNQVEEAYFSLIAARENVRVQEKALQLAEELFRENEKRVEWGTMTPIEAAEAQAQASTTKSNLLSAQRLVRAQENVLKGAMVDDFLRWQGVSLVPIGGLASDQRDFEFQASWHRALATRPDLQMLELQLQQRYLLERRRKNQLLPELDLTVGAGYAGSGREISGVVDEIGSRAAPYYSLGLSLSLPLRNRQERENHRIAAIETEQAKLRLKQLRQNLMIQIDDVVHQARTDYQRIGTTREARQYAEQALANEEGKLARGTSTNFIVLQLQRNLTAARSEEIQSLSDYNRSLSRIRLLEGLNLQAHQVEITFE